MKIEKETKYEIGDDVIGIVGNKLYWMRIFAICFDYSLSNSHELSERESVAYRCYPINCKNGKIVSTERDFAFVESELQKTIADFPFSDPEEFYI